MFCKNCGNKAEGAKRFCINCGAAFSGGENKDVYSAGNNQHHSIMQTKKVVL